MPRAAEHPQMAWDCATERGQSRRHILVGKRRRAEAVEGEPGASTQAEGGEHNDGRFGLLEPKSDKGESEQSRDSRRAEEKVHRSHLDKLGLTQRKEAPTPMAQTRRKEDLEMPLAMHNLGKALSAPGEPGAQRLRRLARYLQGAKD